MMYTASHLLWFSVCVVMLSVWTSDKLQVTLISILLRCPQTLDWLQHVHLRLNFTSKKIFYYCFFLYLKWITTKWQQTSLNGLCFSQFFVSYFFPKEDKMMPCSLLRCILETHGSRHFYMRLSATWSKKDACFDSKVEVKNRIRYFFCIFELSSVDRIADEKVTCYIYCNNTYRHHRLISDVAINS